MDRLGMDVDLRSAGSRLACVVAAGAALALVLAALTATPPSARAAIEIHPASGASGAPLAAIKKGDCRLRGTKPNKIFLAGGKSTDGAFVLDVQVREWQGYRHDYPLFFGADLPASFTVVGGGVTYGNIFSIPGTPPGVVVGGAIAFGKKAKRMSLGFFGAPNQDFSQGATLSSAMKCKKKKR